MNRFQAVTPIRIAKVASVLAGLTSLPFGWIAAGRGDLLEHALGDWLPFALMVAVSIFDVAQAFLLRRRKNRYATAAWFAFTSVVGLAMSLETTSGTFALLLLVPRLAAIVALICPRIAPKSADHPLPSLPMSWAVTSFLLVSVGMEAANAISNPGDREQLMAVSGPVLGAFFLFLSLALFSRFGGFRWAIVPVVLFGSWLLGRGLERNPEPLAQTLWIAGPVVFVAAFDWLRAPATAWARFRRSAAVLSVVALTLPIAAAPHQMLRARGLIATAIYVLCFAMSAAIAPRLGGVSWSPLRRARRMSSPRILAIAVPLCFALVLIPISLFAKERLATLAVGVSCAAVIGLAALRVRFLRALSAYGLGVLVIVDAFIVASAHNGAERVLPFACLILLWTIALWSSRLIALSTPRVLRLTSEPAPRASLGLAAAGCAIAIAVMIPQIAGSTSWRVNAVGALAGPIAVQAVAPFSARTIQLSPDQDATTGGTVAIDPLGRGTWIIDEENDEVDLIDAHGGRRAFPVGAWPEQLAVNSKGQVFVTCRGSGEVAMIDTEVGTSVVPIGAEPRALALDEAKRRLYVALVTGRALVSIDTKTMRVLGRMPLEAEPRTIAHTPQGIAVLPSRGGEVLFASADLRSLERVPLYAHGRQSWRGEALLPVGEDLVVIHTAIDTGLQTPVPSGGYGGGVSEPVETVVAFLHQGRPAIYGPSDRWRVISTDVSDVTAAMWSQGRLFIASRGTHHVLECRFNDTVTRPCDLTIAEGQGLTGLARAPSGEIVTLAAFDRRLLFSSAGKTDTIDIGRGRLPPQVAEGRRLFHLADDRRITGSQMACATCHPDGREDGLVWRLKGTLRQTPQLAARLEHTAPYNWLGTSPTLTSNIHQTVERLGGKGIRPDEEEALAAYVLHGLRAPTRPSPSEPAEVVARGKRLFDSPAVGCASCHDRTREFTDGYAYDVGSIGKNELSDMRAVDPKAKAEDMDVPSLLYVGLTAPYFHDGSARTLDELIEHNGDRMGKTSGLSREERRALAAYLKTL
jgi:hypothetical protein